MARPNESDAEFYSDVHRMCREAREWSEKQTADRRQRQAFACRQWVAFGEADDDGNHVFQEVDCCDLSTGGFSFLAPDVPASDHLVVRLGGEDSFVFLTAKAVNCRPYLTIHGTQFFVGCRFIGRVPSDENLMMEAGAA
jgi:hypothetical protein